MDNGVRYLVDLGKIECVCRQWQISGIPCKHAMAAIVKDRKNVEDYVHSYFSKDMYLRAHGRMIHPILDPTMWTMVPGDPLEPPPLRRLSGRPRKNRKRAADELEKTGKRSQTVRCVWCKEFGHNKRTCQRGPVRGRGGATTKGTGSRGMGRGGGTFDIGSGGNMGDNIAASRGSSSRGRGSSTRGRGTSTRGRGTSRGRGNTRGRGNSRGRGSNRGRGTNTSTAPHVNEAGTSQTQPSQCVTQSHPSNWAPF